MRARRFPKANQIFQLVGGNEDNDLWVEVGVTDDENLGEVASLRSVWVFTDEERERVFTGANISLTILGKQQPPVMMQVTTEEIGKGKG